MSDRSSRGWLKRLGLKAEDPDPEEWVVVENGSLDAESRTHRAERAVAMLADAGIAAEAQPYVLADDSGTKGILGIVEQEPDVRTRIAVVVHRRDQPQATVILQRRPKAEPISDEELARLAEEAGPPPPE